MRFRDLDLGSMEWFVALSPEQRQAIIARAGGKLRWIPLWLVISVAGLGLAVALGFDPPGWAGGFSLTAAIATFGLDAIALAIGVVAWRSVQRIFAGNGDPRRLRGPMSWGAAAGALGLVGWFVLAFSGFGVYSIFPVKVTEYTWSQPAAAILFIAALPCGLAAARLAYSNLGLKVPFPAPPAPPQRWPDRPL